MRIPGWRRAKRVFRWVRSRRRGSVLVLGYHRIDDDRPDPYGIAVTPGFFERQMEVLARRARPLRLREAAHGLSGGRVPPRAVVVTFDDGYADTLHSALPVLERHGVPATVFVTTGSLGDEFWWDRLARIVFEAPGDALLRLEVSGKAREWRVEGETDRKEGGRRQRLVEEIHWLLLAASPTEREAALGSLRTQAGALPGDLDGPRALTGEEVNLLAASPLVEIGAHGVSHSTLASLPTAVQRREVEGSRAALETLIGKPVTSFSYPHGSLSRETVGIVENAGFTVGCCSREDVASPATDLLALPRFWVRDRDGASFARWLERWLHG